MLRRFSAFAIRPRTGTLAALAAATTPTRAVHSPPELRAVKVENLMAAPGVSYPTIYNGLFYRINIFDRIWWNVDSQKAVQAMIWNHECFLPTKPAVGLGGTPFEPLSRIAAFQAAKHRSGREGLIAKNELRKTVWKEIVDVENERKMFDAFIDHLAAFQERPTVEGAQLISNVAFWSQWLIRGYLFEGKLHNEQFCSAVVPAPLSTIAYAANAALGRHQIEFVYDDYTLKAANFPTDRSFESVNYDDPQDILRYVADIWTPVGFCDIDGHHPEHNFRHNHSLMEQQMRRAIKGWLHIRTKKSTGEAVINGWRDVAIAAERAHKVFKTMMGGTPAETYPLVRLMIKGVRGGAGNVYAPHGVFYEGCGTDVFEGKKGCYVDREFGQTGANSSMYKWFDILIGVTKQRGAYLLNDAQRNKMLRVLSGHEDPGDMGVNPIDSMQRAFDLLTRPPLHLDFLVSTSDHVDRIPTILDVRQDPRLASNWELAAFERFKVAFYVASHRNVHGLYVLKMIYQTTPVGGQSRAEGTGGSTPPFLKTFFDQTFSPAMTISDEILKYGRPEVLGEEKIKFIHAMRAQLNSEMEQMTKVQAKGLELERQEKGGQRCPITGQQAAAH